MHAQVVVVVVVVVIVVVVPVALQHAVQRSHVCSHAALSESAG